jgi:hypothetical protein
MVLLASSSSARPGAPMNKAAGYAPAPRNQPPRRPTNPSTLRAQSGSVLRSRPSWTLARRGQSPRGGALSAPPPTPFTTSRQLPQKRNISRSCAQPRTITPKHKPAPTSTQATRVTTHEPPPRTRNNVRPFTRSSESVTRHPNARIVRFFPMKHQRHVRQSSPHVITDADHTPHNNAPDVLRTPHRHLNDAPPTRE